MSFFGGGGKSAPVMPRAPGRPDGKSILPVGSKVLVTQDVSGDGRIALSDEPGHMQVGSVGVGAEVEVTAWRPRGGWGTRYRVRLVDGSEGWVDAASLRARPEPPVVRRAPAPAPAPASPKTPSRPKRGRKPKSA